MEERNEIFETLWDSLCGDCRLSNAKMADAYFKNIRRERLDFVCDNEIVASFDRLSSFEYATGAIVCFNQQSFRVVSSGPVLVEATNCRYHARQEIRIERC